MESGSGFTPRREFLRDPTPATPNTFSLLAISGSNCIRLYSFPLPVITALRRLLDSQNLVTNIREDIDQQLCEIALGGKPWTSAKSLPTEKLLLEIIAVIYQHSYTYLSCIDYGRENDDRLAMAFSKPLTRSLSPLSPADSPLPPTLALSNRRIPFALSFTSATMMRVIAPPLHSTPAILQAVRGAWPRGVVSEKKVGDNCFEFKLKGYKWFHEDTFATDSLRYILSLLSALDAHSFTLLTSITLTNRSRIKDLWIFTGPAASSMDSLPESPAPSILSGSNPEFRRAHALEMPTLSPTSNQTHHRRLLSEPSSSPPMSQTHVRAATDSPSGVSPFRQSNVLRKAAPRAQVPVSVRDSDPPVQEDGALHVNLPSVVPSNVENFTGVGASGRTPDVLYSTSNPPLGDAGETRLPVLLPVDAPHSRSATPPSRGGGSPQLPGYIESHSPASLSPRSQSTPLVDLALVQPPVVHSNPSTPGTPPLLSPGAFRDSAFSSATESTYDVPIPIKWTGTHAEEVRDSLGPPFPGGWQPTPIEEKPEDISGFEDPSEQDAICTPDVQEVVQRVESPDLQAADLALRKSEAGLVGLIAATENQESSGSANEGKGWVVVDVEGQGKDLPDVSSPEALTSASPSKTVTKEDSSSSVATPVQQSPVPHAAKAIAIVDAIEAKNKVKSPPTDSSSGVRKFLSLRRKDSDATTPNESTRTLGSESSKATATAGPVTQVSEDDTKRAIELVHNASVDKAEEKPKSRLRDKLRFRGGPPEAQRNEDKRRSIN